MEFFSTLDSEKLNTLVDKVKKNFFQDPTYSLKIIIDWLDIKNIPYTFASSRVDNSCLYQTGVRVKIKNQEISIQTHPSVAGWAFAETLNVSNMLSDTRHKTPEDLFSYLEKLENAENKED